MRDLTELDKYRITLPPDTLEAMGVDGPVDPRYNGAFVVPRASSVPNPLATKLGLPGFVTTVELRVIAASGGGWDHVSVSVEGRCPTWDEMEHVAKLFFRDNEVAMQLHVPAADHINQHPWCLHWWRPHSKLKPIPLPPKRYV